MFSKDQWHRNAFIFTRLDLQNNFKSQNVCTHMYTNNCEHVCIYIYIYMLIIMRNCISLFHNEFFSIILQMCA